MDALQRIDQLHARIDPLRGAAALPPAPPAATAATIPGATAVPLATAATALAPATTFAGALAQAQAPGLPPRAAAVMTAGQRQFATQLAAETGLDPGVVAAWTLAEQSSDAARSREAAGNHNWLNIGYTDTATYGAAASVWRDPAAAAHATAGWLRGERTVDGYGAASAGVQSILAAAGQPPEAQIAALQRSGWASSGYPDLPALLRQLS